MMKWSLLALGATVVLLLLADFLAFHDLFEPHTGTEWLVLAASVLAIVAFAGVSMTRLRVADRS
jgi:hypothetical protein